MYVLQIDFKMMRRFLLGVVNSRLSIRTCSTEREIATNESANEISKSVDCLSRYTPEQSQKILTLANSLNLVEFDSYGISEGRAKKLIAWKSRNGSLQTIQDMLLIDGFGLKAVDKLCRCLLEQPVNKEHKKPTAKTRLGNFLTPALDAERRELITSCVSLRIGVSSVTWARLELATQQHNAPCQLTHWQHHEICEKKLHINDLVQRCLYVDHMIPTADCYVFENPQTAQIATNPGSKDQQNISIQKSQISAILSFAVARRSSNADNTNTDSTTPALKGLRVYYLRRFLAARLFKHLVGTERVSSEESVLEMMRTHYNIPAQQDFLLEEEDVQTTSTNGTDEKTQSSESLYLRRYIQFNNEQRNMFARAVRYHREFLGQALLINLAFVRLALLQDAESIAAVSKLSNKDKDQKSVQNERNERNEAV